MFKKGDKVFVSVAGMYTITDIGSCGVVKAVVNRSALVKFYTLTGEEALKRHKKETWVLELEDLSPLTKLHRLLYGIENAD